MKKSKADKEFDKALRAFGLGKKVLPEYERAIRIMAIIDPQGLVERIESAGAAVGNCYEWAVNYALGPDWRGRTGATLVHGIITISCGVRTGHAWVELDGVAYDWQTMEGGAGGKYCGKGYPIKVFYDTFKPEKTTRYTTTEVKANCIKYKVYGPWEVTPC